jgi:hypothetical protein
MERICKAEEKNCGNIAHSVDDLTAEIIRYYSDTTVWSIKNVALQEAI